MLIVLVDVHVKPECRQAFIEATNKNASASRLEPGIARFDVLVNRDRPEHFQLIEVYRDDAAPASHKQTAHYLEWRDNVAEMMATPRASAKFENLSPGDSEFG